MYYIVKNEIFSWKNHTMMADLLMDDNASLHYEELAQWFSSSPIKKKIPELTFMVNTNAPFPDFYSSGTHIWLFSTKLIKLMEMYNVGYELHPVRLIDWKTKKNYQKNYAAFRILDRVDALNIEESDFDDFFCNKLILNSVINPMGKLFFKDKKLPYFLMHDDLKLAIENENISGFQFFPVESYSSKSLISLN